LDMRRAAWLDRVYRRSHSLNSRHAAEMALKAFDRVFGEPAESIIDKVKRGELDVYVSLTGLQLGWIRLALAHTR